MEPVFVENIENDDFCDLPDGSDETKTSACSYLKNVQFICSFDQKRIPTSRVQDGICDCCDGSDEINSPFPILCPIKCGPHAEKGEFLSFSLRRRHNNPPPQPIIRLPKINYQPARRSASLSSSSTSSTLSSSSSSSLKSFLHSAPFLLLLMLAVIYLIVAGCRVIIQMYRQIFQSSSVLPLDSTRLGANESIIGFGLLRRGAWNCYFLMNCLSRWKKSPAHKV